jgi:hypothetical protein
MPSILIELLRTQYGDPQRFHIAESYCYTFTYRRLRKNRTALVTLTRQRRTAGVVSRATFDDFSTQLAV